MARRLETALTCCPGAVSFLLRLSECLHLSRGLLCRLTAHVLPQVSPISVPVRSSPALMPRWLPVRYAVRYTLNVRYGYCRLRRRLHAGVQAVLGHPFLARARSRAHDEAAGLGVRCVSLDGFLDVAICVLECLGRRFQRLLKPLDSSLKVGCFDSLDESAYDVCKPYCLWNGQVSSCGTADDCTDSRQRIFCALQIRSFEFNMAVALRQCKDRNVAPRVVLQHEARYEGPWGAWITSSDAGPSPEKRGLHCSPGPAAPLQGLSSASYNPKTGRQTGVPGSLSCPTEN
jgi:hypothetical protein